MTNEVCCILRPQHQCGIKHITRFIMKMASLRYQLLYTTLTMVFKIITCLFFYFLNSTKCQDGVLLKSN